MVRAKGSSFKFDSIWPLDFARPSWLSAWLHSKSLRAQSTSHYSSNISLYQYFIFITMLDSYHIPSLPMMCWESQGSIPQLCNQMRMLQAPSTQSWTWTWHGCPFVSLQHYQPVCTVQSHSKAGYAQFTCDNLSWCSQPCKMVNGLKISLWNSWNLTSHNAVE